MVPVPSHICGRALLVVVGQDGRLAGPPVVMNPQNTPYFLAASESAIRAVQACDPYPLPASKYDAWKDMVLNLDPRDMY